MSNFFMANWSSPIYLLKYLKARLTSRLKIRPVKKGNTPILVHQMGKVGSQTLCQSIRDSNTGYPVFHTHFLSPDDLNRKWIELTEYNNLNWIPHHILIAMELRNHLFPVDDQEIIIISSVRELVSRQISLLYQAPFLAEKRVKDKNGLIDADLASQYLINKIQEKNTFDYPQHWFDKQLKNYFGIDVFNYDFNRDEGWAEIREGNVSVLVVQMEKLDELIPLVVTRFLGASKPLEISNRNVRKKKSYRQTINNVKIPLEVLDQIYQSKFMQHFYSPEDIAAFKKRWKS